MSFVSVFTDDGESGSPNQWRICGNETFENSGIVEIGKLNLKFPIVWLFVKYLESRVTAVRSQPERQKVRCVTVTF